MDILTLARELREAADLVVADKDGRSLLFVEVHSEPDFQEEYLSQLVEDHRKFDFPFAMFAGPTEILLFGPDHSSEPVARLPTIETLSPYDPYFDKHKPMSSHTLGFLMWPWLNDFTTDLNSKRPPQRCCLEKAGLADKLLGAEVISRGMLFRYEDRSERFF